VDTKIQGWFDRGQVAEAVIGDDDFFIRESAFVIHDRIFILRQLHEWAATEERAATATAGVDAAVTRLLETDRPDEAIDVLNCVAILAEDGITIPLDSARVARWLGEAEEKYVEHADRRAKALERLRRSFPEPSEG